MDAGQTGAATHERLGKRSTDLDVPLKKRAISNGYHRQLRARLGGSETDVVERDLE